MNSLNRVYENIANKNNTSKTTIEHIYNKYLKLIKQKALEVFKYLQTEDIKEKQDMYYNRGDYCFYLRYLGKYFINYKAYKKWKSKISNQLNQDSIM